MWNLSFVFATPWYLFLLLLAPLVWWMAAKSLGGLDRVRAGTAVGLRLVILALLIGALLEPEYGIILDRIAVMFVVDQSQSIPSERRQALREFVENECAVHQNLGRGDMAGVIAFGRDPAIEDPPTNAPYRGLDSPMAVDGSATNLQAAMKLARAVLPAESARRIVVVSDGNENVGSALAEADELVADGIAIDTIGAALIPGDDVVAARALAPSHARVDTPFEVTIVLEYHTEDKSATTSGRLSVTKRMDGADSVVSDEPVELRAGKNVYTVKQELKDASFYTYSAKFSPSDVGRDQFSQNNQVSTSTVVGGKAKILFLGNAERASDGVHLIERLRANGITVDVRPATQWPTSLYEFQSYDGVMLGDVPRVFGSEEENLVQVTDDQIKVLVAGVEKLGIGLVLLGGPNALGAGGWAKTDLEKASPVDFHVENAKVRAVGALMLVIDHSGSMAGPKLTMSKAAASAAVDMLGPQDEIGVITFDSNYEEVHRLSPIGDRPHRIKTAISRIGEGGGTNLYPGMRKGYERLLASKASTKHMIVLTDGQTEGRDYDKLASSMRAKGITTSSVAIGSDAARKLLQQIANQGNGKFYQVNNPKSIPRVFMVETRRVVRPLVFEQPQGLPVHVGSDHPALRGMNGELPSIQGLVLTKVKENPLVEVPLEATGAAGVRSPLMATWTYGAGRVAVFTSDAGDRWTGTWLSAENYDPFFVQLVRWCARPVDTDDTFVTTVDQRDDRTRVTLTGIDRLGGFVNGLNPVGGLIRSDGAGNQPLNFKQVGPGRYVAEVANTTPGNYLVTVAPADGRAPLTSGLDVPNDLEYRARSTNDALMTSLASFSTASTPKGRYWRLPDAVEGWKGYTEPDVFRPGPPHRTDHSAVWHFFALTAACLFVFDVANRRCMWTGPIAALYALMSKRKAPPPASNTRIDRLRAAKSSANASARFEAPTLSRSESLEADTVALGDEGTSSGLAGETPVAADGVRSDEYVESYAERLLRAKKAAHRKGSDG